jgi:hypothetical protein
MKIDYVVKIVAIHFKIRRRKCGKKSVRVMTNP